MIEMMRIIGEHTSGVVPPHEIQTSVEATCAHLTSLEALETPTKPKHHMMMELAARMHWFGSPSIYGCFRDEHLNGVLKLMANKVHRRIFMRRVLIEWRVAYGIRSRTRGGV